MAPGWTQLVGSPYPLGATWLERERAYNFALHSEHARHVTLLIYSIDDPLNPLLSRTLSSQTHKSGPIWHCRIPESDIPGAEFYAYRVEGPNHSDPGKILLDPYASAVHFPPAFERAAAMRAGANDGKAPLGYLPRKDEPFDWGDDEPPHHESTLVIYELHVRGFTMRDPDVPPEHRGTYLGIIDKIPYLKRLGITAVELMPVFQTDPQEGNYWGYSPMSFFAVHAGFAVGGDPIRARHQFREMVRSLHAQGIEVIIDVVYNHTCELDHRGPTYSLRGIDPESYYLTTDDPDRPYADFTGAGNTLRITNRFVRRLIVKSLVFWALEMRVDGFRFDLATVAVRNADGTLNFSEPPILGDILSRDERIRRRFILEPWDARGASLLGNAFPARIGRHWNDQFRDDVRRFIRGDPGLVPSMVRRIYGSDDLFPDTLRDAQHPYQSVNYATSHDGFTLWDLVSYNELHNRANGHENTDGPANEYSCNHGFEGDRGVPGSIVKIRKQQARNFMCVLMLSNGTPMIRAGDEFLQTQSGNSNPYNQDNETSWLDWSRPGTHADFARFVRLLIAFRKHHPSLCPGRFWRDDVRWLGPDGPIDHSSDSRAIAYLLTRDAPDQSDIYAIFNADDTDRTFKIMSPDKGVWRRSIDTALPSPDDIRDTGDEQPIGSGEYPVRARSCVVLIREGD